MIDDAVARAIIAAALGEIVDSAASEHFSALTQEHQLSSRIAERLETAIPRLREATGYDVSIYTQELPDRGRGALEHSVGADLYVGIQIRAGSNITSKGILVQAKWRDAISRYGTVQELASQCANIAQRTKSGYVWLYGQRGARVVSAKAIVKNPDMLFGRSLFSRRTERLFDGILKCREGDPAIGLPRLPRGTGEDAAVIRQAIGTMLSDLRVQTGIGILIDGDG